MAKPTIALLEYLRNTGTDLDGDFLRESIALLTRLLMEAEVSEQIGVERYEHSDDRLGHRNGYRERSWETRVGDIPVWIPKLRRGSYFPSFLEPRRRAERALIAVIQSAYVEGVSTRKVDDLVQALGLAGVDKSKVSRICKELDEAVTAFRNRPLEEAYPYLWLDGLYLKVRQNHRIVNMAVVIAIGVRESGERDILAIGNARTLIVPRGRTPNGPIITTRISAVMIARVAERCKRAVRYSLVAKAQKRDRILTAVLRTEKRARVNRALLLRLGLRRAARGRGVYRVSRVSNPPTGPGATPLQACLRPKAEPQCNHRQANGSTG
jgi:hypothetical protein